MDKDSVHVDINVPLTFVHTNVVKI